jgi:kanamycin nucleotidyltransferase
MVTQEEPITTFENGPRPHTQAQRLQLAQEIAAQIHQHYGEHVLALGLYGSLGRGTDGPYSDIEMHCVLQGVTIDMAHEWSAGPWKAEVDVYDEETVLGMAAEVEGDWPLTHGAYVYVRPLYDPAGFFGRLRQAALNHPDEVFAAAMHELIVGELYEFIGKIRNAWDMGNTAALPAWTVDLARHGGYLIGLANRHLYSTSSTLLAESLGLAGRPDGYDALCGLVMSGRLADGAELVAAANRFWEGVEAWAAGRALPIVQELAAILAGRPFLP